MAGLSERERVWFKKIEETKVELGEKDKELKAVQAELKEELEKAQPRDNLLAFLERREAILSKQWASLDTELQKFQDILAAGGMCAFDSYALICAFDCCVGDLPDVCGSVAVADW